MDRARRAKYVRAKQLNDRRKNDKIEQAIADDAAAQDTVYPDKSWEGGEKVPPWLAEHLGVPADQVTVVEVREAVCGVKEAMYAIINDYVYHRCVSMGEPVPPPPKKKKKLSDPEPAPAPPSEGPAPAGEPPTDKEPPAGKDPPADKDALADKELPADKEPPQPDEDASDKPGPASDPGEEAASTSPEGSVAQMFDSDGDEVGVDPAAVLDDLSPKERDALLRKARLNNREAAGRLSSLTGSVRVVNARRLRAAPGERRDPSAAAFSFGLGFAHTLHGGAPVVVGHVSRGGTGSARTLLVHAVSPGAAKGFLQHVKRWHFARYRAEEQHRGKYYLHMLQVSPTGRGTWCSAGMKESRSMASIILREGQLATIAADFRDFQAPGTRRWYAEHGLPHRRSYLFYGPPGVGKTSTIRALAGELRLAACFLSLSDSHFQNKTLHDAIMTIPRPSMLVLEDIDVLFNESRRAQGNSFLTFSGLLNALDGLVSADNILTVMTTNHPERLDPALIRAGRVDRRFEFKAPDRAQMANYFRSFYPAADPALARRFAERVFQRPEKEAKSLATLQEHFIHMRGKTAQECADAVDTFFEEFYPNSLSPGKPSYTM